MKIVRRMRSGHIVWTPQRRDCVWGWGLARLAGRQHVILRMEKGELEMDQLFPRYGTCPHRRCSNSLAVRRKGCPWRRRSWHSPASSQTRFTRPALEWSAPVAQAVSEHDYADPDCRSDSIVVLGDRINASIILVIVVIGSVLGFWQERGAADAVAPLLAVMQTKATVLRDGNDVNVAFADVVPGALCCLRRARRSLAMLAGGGARPVRG